jgi:GT2 family glycosyltransferase
VMERPRVSVCIANYNGSEMIAGCIESVLAQDCSFAVEILVHDDASSDDSIDIVTRDFSSVRMIRSESNVGFCIANNRMVAAAQGDYVLLLNNDAELLHDSLRVLMDEAESLGRPAILSLPQHDYLSGDVIDRGCLLDPFFNPVPNLDQDRRDVAMVIGACLWLPKELWADLGGFPEWFGSIGEDLYLCCSARLAGYSVLVTGRSGYRHRVGQSFGGGIVRAGHMVSSYRRRTLSERNKTFVMVLCCPMLMLLIMLPLHMTMLLIEGAVLSVLRMHCRPLADIYLPVALACWREREHLYNVRQAVQAAKRSGMLAFLSVFSPLPYKLTMLFKRGLPRLD